MKRHNRITVSSDHSVQGMLKSVIWPLVISTLVTLWIASGPAEVRGAALLFTQEPMIVSLQSLNGPCVDSAMNEVADLAEWTSSAGSCDRVVCHVEPSGNYTVTHTCRQRHPGENPDTDNCEWVSNTTRAYPDCCPQLVCGQAATFTTIDPATCYDLASSYACGIWYNLTSACTDIAVDVYNISQTFCRQTCGIC